ncbi:hypothetical protein MAM1_0472d10659 [Mucor ambiguus]|uniref:C2H2-type domain-containing protein n=1 Tax=Mucor ambiguus TaxID=91626 RepID=A0A0C9N4V4_9FUNG|nr:hypothetical protein MAM1_0472d10659 [Mucor ambiguus]
MIPPGIVACISHTARANPVTDSIAKELVVRHLHLSRKRIAEIDINGSNCYCAKCDQELETKNIFVQHARTVHGLQLPPRTMRNLEAAVDPNDPNWYCSQ